MNNDEIIAKANEFYEKLNGQRQEDEEGLLVKSHILTLADQPEKTILVLMSEEYEDAYIYEPTIRNSHTIRTTMSRTRYCSGTWRQGMR